jgi:hypothetical protein
VVAKASIDDVVLGQLAAKGRVQGEHAAQAHALVKLAGRHCLGARTRLTPQVDSEAGMSAAMADVLVIAGVVLWVSERWITWTL